MAKPILKRIESRFKKLLKQALLFFLQRKDAEPVELESIRKVLVFRLDQRVGNGILLIPLLKAISEAHQPIQLHFLIHHPIASLLAELPGVKIDRTWAYNQPQLLSRPWRYISLVKSLRQEQYDVVLSSNNPDNFSLSQAIFGRLMKPRCLVGFDARDSAPFFDIAVQSSTRQHYSKSMVDLWKAVYPPANWSSGGLQVSNERKIELVKRYPQFGSGGILLWLGATGRKVLPGTLFAEIHQHFVETARRPIHFVAGPADEDHLADYPAWIREQTLIWRNSLSDTATLFSLMDGFVSADTGPMHLAVALDVPTLAIFLNDNIIQYGYQVPQRHQAVRWTGTADSRHELQTSLRQFVARLKERSPQQQAGLYGRRI